jgi:hypothetical protein
MLVGMPEKSWGGTSKKMCAFGGGFRNVTFGGGAVFGGGFEKKEFGGVVIFGGGFEKNEFWGVADAGGNSCSEVEKGFS